MRGLIEEGFVYIASPPLYKVKQGNQEQYIEKESELEDWLLERNLGDLALEDASEGAPPALGNGLTRALPALPADPQGARGLGRQPARDLRIGHGGLLEPTAWWRPSRRTSRTWAGPSTGVRRTLGPHRRGRRPDGEGLLARSVHARTGEARTVRIPLEICRSRELAGLQAPGRLRELVTPPFRVSRGAPLPHRGQLRGAAHGRPRPLPGGPAQPLQGPRRDEQRAALGDDDGPRAADPPARHHGGRGGRGRAVRQADGGQGGAAPRSSRTTHSVRFLDVDLPGRGPGGSAWPSTATAASSRASSSAR